MTTQERYLPHDWFPNPLPTNVEIGQRSWLYSTFAFIHYHSRQPVGLRIGSDSGIYNGTFFELGLDGEVEIGNYCAIVGAIIATNGRVEIGDYTLIAHEVVIADNFAAIPPSVNNIGQKMPSDSGMTIGANVWIGARAILLGEIHIGEGAIVGAGAVVTNSVPPFTIVAGNPSRIVRTIGRSSNQQ